MITIRSAVAADENQVFELLKNFAMTFTPEQESFRGSFARLLRNPEAVLLVADRSSAVLGYLLGSVHDAFFANGPVGWIEEITVQDGMRRQGIGRKLMQSFEEIVCSRGSRFIALATRRAPDFYAALDYKESAVYFHKILPQPQQ
jgi:ribosomal protein S18 acetylase RimI-like enzyme